MNNLKEQKRIFLVWLIVTMIATIFACENPYFETVADMGNQDNLLLDIEYDNGFVLENDYEILDSIPITPQVITTKGAYRDRVIIDWEPVVYKDYSVSYHVYKTVDFKDMTRITGDSSIQESSWIDFLDDGIIYNYAVRAVVEDLKSNGMVSGFHQGYTLGTPYKVSASYREFNDKIIINWDKVPGASYYLVKRAKTTTEVAPEWEYEYAIISDAIVDLTYTDYEVSADFTYWYKLFALYDNKTISRSSPVAQGAIVEVGAPEEVMIDYVSKGIMANGVRVCWQDTDASKFLVNKITESQFESGNYIGREYSFQKSELNSFDNEGITYYYWYDVDSALLEGDKFYYRVVAENTIGKGKPSSFKDNSDYRKSQGYGIEDLSAVVPEVLVTANGFYIQVPECAGAKGFYLFSSFEDPQSYTLADWGAPIAYLTDQPYFDNPDGITLESDRMWYRLLPADEKTVEIASDGTISNLAYEWNSKVSIASLIAETDLIADFTPLFGYSTYTLVGDDFTVPVPTFSTALGATQDDEAYKGTIKITGMISDTSGFDKLRVKLIRRCYYGDETGVYPLTEPRRAIGGVSYTKKGLPHIESVEEFDVKEIINMDTGYFEMLDPMHDFRDGELIIRNGEPDTVKWDYATWDREAWKDIKRQKPFDIERAVKIDYEVRIERLGDPEWGANFSIAEGWPALTNLQFAHFINWGKEPAFSRLTYILIPRYGWAKTLAWLVGTNAQTINGEFNKYEGTNGRAYLSVWVEGLGAAGNGSIRDDYCDWPGFLINMKDNNGDNKDLSMSVSTDANQKRRVTSWFTVTTPVYSGTCYMDIYCRDYNYHWGLWEDAGKQGEFSVWHKDRGKVRFDPEEVLIFRNEPDGGTFGWEDWDTGGEGFSGDFGNSCLYSRINFKFRPYPMNQDFIKEKDPVQYYGYEY